jgi:SAM-dependent methyltransferase
MPEPRDWDLRGDQLATEAIAAGHPTQWFDQLYREGDEGAISMPWDRDAPNPLLREWVEAQGVDGTGRRAVVVGCGLGADAEYLSSLGFATTAFDIAPTAVRLAVERHPGSRVDYQVGDLLDLPDAWRGGFDLVVEIFTLQALPDPPRADAAAGVRALVAPGGTLLAIQFRLTPDVDPAAGPPFALSRETLEALLVQDGLHLDFVEQLPGPRWRVAVSR